MYVHAPPKVRSRLPWGVSIVSYATEPMTTNDMNLHCYTTQVQTYTFVRTLVLSDLHANLYALEAVLADAEGKYDEIVCCGDLVGYNPHPAPVLEWVKEHCACVVRGNHDKVVAGIENLEWFNDVAKEAARWTMTVLGAEHRAYLRDLPPGPRQIGQFQIWHGSLRDEDEYVLSKSLAAPSFPLMETPLGFFGHSHLQGGYFSKHGRIGVIAQVRKGQSESVFELEPDLVYMVNPGSVGQPRDRDPRAAYAIHDSEQKTVSLRRVPYPAQRTAEDIESAHLPDMLAIRLIMGV